MAHSSNQSIQPDTAFETDSAFGDDGSDLMSVTETLRSSILDYHYENGRRYHAYRAGQYWGPNDEMMLNTLDLNHHVQLLLLDGELFKAPIGPSPQQILDVGTGTGIWAMYVELLPRVVAFPKDLVTRALRSIWYAYTLVNRYSDVADQFPDCQVIGTDLSPNQPQEVPPNLQFEVDDACSEWLHTPSSFDFIHMRCMYGSVADWPRMYQEAKMHLKPGGWFEQTELSVVPKADDGTVGPDSVFAQWAETSLAAGDSFGKTLRVVDESKQGLIDAGFINVVEYRYKLPLGPWPEDQKLKEIGRYNKLHWEMGLEGWAMLLYTNYLGWSKEEVLVFVARMRAMLRDKSVHAYHECSVVFGQRPPE